MTKVIDLNSTEGRKPSSNSHSHNLTKKDVIINLNAVYIQKLDINPKGGINKHPASGNEFLYIITGYGKTWIEDQEIEYSPGDTFLIAKGKTFGLEAEEPTEAMFTIEK